MRSLNLTAAVGALLLVAVSGCTVNVAEPSPGAPSAIATTPGVSARPADGPALAQARQKVRDVTWQIGQEESALRQLSPPIRIRDAKNNVTFDIDKQRQYETDRARIDRKIRALREERLTWELRVNQLTLQQEVQN